MCYNKTIKQQGVTVVKKQAILKSFLILLPVLAVGLATTGNSVMVFDSTAGTTAYYAYFEVLPVAQYQMLPPLAATLSVVAGILAAVYLLNKKTGTLKASYILALIAAGVAVLPIVSTGDVRVIPNVGLPILMLTHYALAYYMAKNEAKFNEEKKAPRLQKK